MNESIDLARQKRLPFRVNRNQEIDFTIGVNDASGAAFDFTGYSSRLEVYNSYNKTETPEFEIAVELSVGFVRFHRAAVNKRREDFVYRWFMVDANGYEQIWTNGPFTLIDSEFDLPNSEDTLTISPSGDIITINMSVIGSDFNISNLSETDLQQLAIALSQYFV